MCQYIYTYADVDYMFYISKMHTMDVVQNTLGMTVNTHNYTKTINVCMNIHRYNCYCRCLCYVQSGRQYDKMGTWYMCYAQSGHQHYKTGTWYMCYVQSGRQYDKDGNLVQWWHDNVIQKFKERAQCIIDQYSNYTVPQVNIQVSWQHFFKLPFG